MYLKQPFINIKNGVIDQRETEMMSVRWKIFQFNVQIEQNDQKEICFLFNFVPGMPLNVISSLPLLHARILGETWSSSSDARKINFFLFVRR